jgi:transposase-like protein
MAIRIVAVQRTKPGISVTLQDDQYPNLRPRFRFAEAGGALALGSVSVEHADIEANPVSITVYQLRADFPWAAWERAARTAAAERLSEPADHLPRPAWAPEESMERWLLLHKVASQYRASVKAGLRNPGAVIAEKHGVNPATARNWVRRAREEGLLGPAKGPTAGETGAPTTDEEPADYGRTRGSSTGGSSKRERRKTNREGKDRG